MTLILTLAILLAASIAEAAQQSFIVAVPAEPPSALTLKP